MLSAVALHELDPEHPGPSNFAFAYDGTFLQLLVQSYARRTGGSLIPGELKTERAAAWLYDDAPFCLLSHNTATDPRFIYGNRTAQRCFEYDWYALTQLPSRLSAGPQDRDERQQFLDSIAAQGFATGYRGLRVARSGRKFWIEDVTLWQVTDDAGVLRAQAAVYQQAHDVAGAT